MALPHILVFCAAAVLSGLVAKGRWRTWFLVAGSVLALYWLQPVTPIRRLDFWLPTATLALAMLVWIATCPRENAPQTHRQVVPTAVLIGGVILVIGVTRYVDPLCCITPTRPPGLPLILLALGILAILGIGFARLSPAVKWSLTSLIVFALGLLLVLKTEPLARLASMGLRALTGQSVEQASALDIGWLGISYIIFRLVHALRDRQIGTLPALSFDEFISYVILFPTITAGPIDRADRFAKDLREPFTLSASDVLEGGQRIVVGLFKKFVVADTLALLALNPANAAQTGSTVWLWVMLYTYAFRIWLDFAGYSDIAIGLGRLAGFRIPENFDRPYTKPDLTAFWNSWHMTLAQWFRSYFFNPVSRALRSGPKSIPPGAIIAFSQISTMVLIGLWHGVTWNYAVWGAWHGVGLFIHNRWANATRAQARKLRERPRLQFAVEVASSLLTFHYVVLGWVWFALPDIGLSLNFMRGLFGL